MVAIAQDGLGDDYVPDGRAVPVAECPVAMWELGISEPDGPLVVVAHDFGARFRDVVEYPDNW